MEFNNPAIQEIYEKVRMEKLKLTPEEYRQVKIASCYENIQYLEATIAQDISFVESLIDWINRNKARLEKEKAKLKLLEEGEQK